MSCHTYSDHGDDMFVTKALIKSFTICFGTIWNKPKIWFLSDFMLFCWENRCPSQYFYGRVEQILTAIRLSLWRPLILLYVLIQHICKQLIETTLSIQYRSHCDVTKLNLHITYFYSRKNQTSGSNSNYFTWPKRSMSWTWGWGIILPQCSISLNWNADFTTDMVSHQIESLVNEITKMNMVQVLGMSV